VLLCGEILFLEFYSKPLDPPSAASIGHGRPKRFGELKRRLGSISTKTLTERLRLMESEGWISRHYEPVVPPQVTYAITAKVRELDGVMIELDRIAEQWYGKKRKET
jgi:DNA-binding HxlR family transcriptional regulator